MIHDNNAALGANHILMILQCAYCAVDCAPQTGNHAAGKMDEPKAEAEKMKKIPAKPKHVDVIDILSSEEESSKEKSVPNKKGREVNSRKKSSRTLTSVLTAISQVACDLTNKPKEIVDTDAANANNELAVVEYLDDIYKFYKLVENESRLHDYMDSQPEIQVQQDVLAPSNNIPALNANTLLRIWTRQLIPRLRMTLVLLLDTFCFAKWPPLVQAGLKAQLNLEGIHCGKQRPILPVDRLSNPGSIFFAM
ncbi:hypothetical protein KIW84_042364 [Lathyrus oleraceus]|uniref:Uncharacterized protein n=1 Tax=Pisum sativum TaxID=3888 RepID=A0A9D4XCK4_PEA|nr:hypothetical protein KIW84_042364 [Pisum sativum]